MKITTHLIGTVGAAPYYSDGKSENRTAQSPDDPQEPTGGGDASGPATSPWSMGTTSPRESGAAEGRSMASFRMAVNYRRFDQRDQQWKDTDTTWYEVVCFGAMAENVRRSINKGERVLVVGRLRDREWRSARTGEEGHRMQIIADAVGHDLRYGMTMLMRAPQASDFGRGPDVENSEGAENIHDHDGYSDDSDSAVLVASGAVGDTVGDTQVDADAGDDAPF